MANVVVTEADLVIKSEAIIVACSEAACGGCNHYHRKTFQRRYYWRGERCTQAFFEERKAHFEELRQRFPAFPVK
jgi:hypothetical protein